jgi:peptidoglycan/LPS O-acetylase OafA/YrhL
MTKDPRPAPRLAYMPGVDGLRAVAVSAVLVYHLGAPWLPGGFLGVDIFLVISGYLITSLLLAERETTGRIDIARFWIRRALRLLPALFLMLIVVMAAMVLLHPGEVGRLHGALLASVGYVANWYFIFADVPYFEQFGRPSVLQHVWSLAVEEQFYLLWPPVLAVGLIFLGRKWLLVIVAAAIAASTALAWWLWEPFADPSRIYYGTDTRAVGLLAGVALALAVPAARRWHQIDGRARDTLDAIGLACLAAIVVATLTLGDLDESLYRGGFLVVALTTAGLIAVVAHPSSRLGRILGTSALVWVGVRSYGIYLWHWPVIMLTRPDADIALDGPALVALRLALIVGVAALSYRYVERPIRRLGFHGTIAAIKAWAHGLSRPVRLATASSAGVAAVALVLAVALLPSDSPRVPGLTGIASAAVVPDYTATAAPGPARGAAAAGARRKPRVLLVGDSVMLGAFGELRRVLGKRAVIDASVSRQFPEGAAAVRKGVRAMPKAMVVIHLGNNGYIPFKELDKLMRDLAGRPRVVLVTVRVPLKWQDSVNGALRDARRRYKNIVIADWHAVSGGPGLLVDGAHTTPKGMRLYARTIAAKVS